MEGKADLHTHTKYSGLARLGFLQFPDSVTEPKELVAMAERKGLSVVCVTDHNSIKGGLKAREFARKVEVVVGEEIMTADGEIIGLFLNEEIPKGLPAAETIDRIHAQEGVAIAVHPFSAECESLGMKIYDLNIDGVEVFNAGHRDGYTNEAAQKLTLDMKVALVAGSDGHSPIMVGNAYTTFDGSTAEDLRRAILAKKTGYQGKYTPLRDIVWQVTMSATELYKDIGRSLLHLKVDDETAWGKIIPSMRSVSKIVSMIGATAFLVPPVPIMAGVIGEKIHRNRSKALFDKLVHSGLRLR